MNQDLENTADLLTLEDEDGNEHEFEIVDTADFEGNSYVALVPTIESPEESQDDSEDLVILKVVQDGEEEFLEPIDNDEEFDRVGAFFMERLKDTFDFED